MKACITPIYGKGQQVRSYSTAWTTPKRDIQCSISEEMRYEQIVDGLYIVAQNKKCNRLSTRLSTLEIFNSLNPQLLKVSTLENFNSLDFPFLKVSTLEKFNS